MTMSYLVVETNRRELEFPVVHSGGMYFHNTETLAHDLFETTTIVDWRNEYIRGLHWVRGDCTYGVRYDSVVGVLLIER